MNKTTLMALSLIWFSDLAFAQENLDCAKVKYADLESSSVLVAKHKSQEDRFDAKKMKEATDSFNLLYEQVSDFYISGFEMSNPPRSASGQVSGVGAGTVEMIYPGGPWDRVQVQASKVGKKMQDQKMSAASVSAQENTDGFRKTLESFQKAIMGLFVAYLELNLAFNASTKAWMVVTGEVAGSVKVILKNPDEKCPKS